METPKKAQSNEQLGERLRMSERGFSWSQEETNFEADPLFDSVEGNPLGRLLKIISALPEMRSEKLELARRHLRQSDEVLDAEMDAAVDKVLEELISE